MVIRNVSNRPRDTTEEAWAVVEGGIRGTRTRGERLWRYT